MILKQWNDINLKLEKGDFDIILLGWQTSVTPELFSMFHSSKIIDGKILLNIAMKTWIT